MNESDLKKKCEFAEKQIEKLESSIYKYRDLLELEELIDEQKRNVEDIQKKIVTHVSFFELCGNAPLSEQNAKVVHSILVEQEKEKLDELLKRFNDKWENIDKLANVFYDSRNKQYIALGVIPHEEPQEEKGNKKKKRQKGVDKWK